MTCPCQASAWTFNPDPQQHCQGGFFIDARQLAQLTGSTVAEIHHWANVESIPSSTFRFPDGQVERLFPIPAAAAAISQLLRGQAESWRELAMTSTRN